MSDEKSPAVMRIDAHEELVQHIESGQRKIRSLSLVTVVVSAILVAAYFSQIILPFAGGSKIQTVNLASPDLIAVEVVVLILSAAWLYVGVANYLFATRLGRQVAELRAAERELEKRITG